MVSQYSHLHFFRRVPNELLARYFNSRSSLLDVALNKLKPTNVEPILEAFLKLDNNQ